MMKKIFLFGLIPALAACATPQQKCIRASSQNLHTVNALIAETQANLDRGYAVERYEVTVADWAPCTRYRRNSDGSVVPVMDFCDTLATESRARPKTIDLAQEAVKLKQLQSKQRQLSIETQAATAQCLAMHPK